MASCSILYNYLFQDSLQYLELPGDGISSFSLRAYIISAFKWLLIMSNMIPISMLVSLEMVKLVQAWVIRRDKKMVSSLYGEVIKVSV